MIELFETYTINYLIAVIIYSLFLTVLIWYVLGVKDPVYLFLLILCCNTLVLDIKQIHTHEDLPDGIDGSEKPIDIYNYGLVDGLLFISRTYEECGGIHNPNHDISFVSKIQTGLQLLTWKECICSENICGDDDINNKLLCKSCDYIDETDSTTNH